ncbi:thioredoxin-like domain-containing protein [Sphingobacterium corticis]|uniref:Thioredoxin-like domain-containing protein n=1 Tax=Sphingobacterium corticis TaxID=1812823 RepID=A0ABW5NLP6_9SPHI
MFKIIHDQQIKLIKAISLLTLIICPLISCGQKIEFRVEGKFDKPFRGTLYLFYNSIIDSVLVNGLEYAFTGAISGPTEASLRTKNGFSSGYLYLDKGITKIVSTIDSLENGPVLTSVKHVSGNETHDVVIPKMLNAMDQTKLEMLLDVGKTEEIVNTTRELLEEFPNHPLSAEILSSFASMDFITIYEIESLLGILNKEAIPQKSLEEINQAIEKKKIYRVGSQLFDFGFTDKNNRLYSINDFKGKYLLIEFWSAGCDPCRAEHPFLINTREQYSEKFEILGVSFDTNDGVWHQAVLEDQLTWVNTRIKNEVDKAVIEKLGIYFIPSNFLLDPSGRILAVNIKARQLKSRLDTELNSKVNGEKL